MVRNPALFASGWGDSASSRRVDAEFGAISRHVTPNWVVVGVAMFSQLRIGSKLLIGFGAILSLLMGVTALATFSAVRSSESLEKMATLKSAEVLEQRIEARLGEARLHFWIAFKSNGQSDDQTHWNASIEDFKTVGQWMNTLAAGAVDSDRAPIGQQMAGLVQRYAELVGKLHDDQTQIGLLPDEEVEKATADLTKIEIDVANQGAALASSYRTASEIMVSEREASSRLIEMIIIVSGIAGLFFGASLSVLFARSIGRPILAMVGVMKALAAGKLEVSIPNAGDRTELGEMARTIAIFRDSAVEKERLEAEAAQRRAIVDLDRQRNEEAQRAAIAHERAIVAESIGSGLSNLAAKNLTYRMTSHIPDAYLQLQTDFNSAIAQLETALSSVVTSADVIHADSREIMGATDELSSRTERQAANLEETVATLGEVTTAAKKAAAGTVHAHQVVSKAQSYARETDEVIGKAIAAMGEIEKSSSQIGQIVGMIEEIAFQTSLLALNAGVEAARVGDAGRGFAVVASEVRALSQRSAEAANEIKGLISNATKQVNSGVALVVETGKSLGQIMRQVKEINGVVTQIAAGASEQSSALEHINSAIIQIDQATQQNAAMVEQSTASSQSLAEEAEQLASLVGQFTVDVRPQGKATRVPTNEMRVAA